MTFLFNAILFHITGFIHGSPPKFRSRSMELYNAIEISRYVKKRKREKEKERKRERRIIKYYFQHAIACYEFACIEFIGEVAFE